MYRIIQLAVSLSLLFQGSLAEYCYLSYGYGYCDYGCCGSYTQYCCSYTSSYYYSTLNVGAIVGAVIGGIIGLVILGSLIACCIIACKSSGTRGRVVRPANNASEFVIFCRTNSTLPGGTSTIPIPQSDLPSNRRVRRSPSLHNKPTGISNFTLPTFRSNNSSTLGTFSRTSSRNCSCCRGKFATVCSSSEYNVEVRCTEVSQFESSLAEICTSRSGIKYCSYGCCGSYSYRSCCSSTSTSTAGSIGEIIGAVVGGIISLAIFITCIVCCAKACTESETNECVMRPANNPQVFVMTTGHTQAYPMGQQPYTYPNPASPPSGGGIAPPPYTVNSPAFGGQGPSLGLAPASAYSGGYPLPTPVPSENNSHK